MADKLPKDITAGTPNDNSVVHASDADVSDLSRSHNERDISRLQGTALAYDAAKTYNVFDLVTESNITYRNIIAIAVPEVFDPSKWKSVEDIIEVGRTEILADTTAFDLTLSPVTKNILIRYFFIATGTIRVQIRFNGDTADNYSEFFSENYGAGTNVTNDDDIQITENASADQNQTGEIIITNVATEEKMGRTNNISSGGLGAGFGADYKVNAFKWVNVIDQINTINFLVDLGVGDIGIGSYAIAFGWD